MRIIAGKFRNRNLRSSRHFRPTTDRVRETLFNILQAEIEGAVLVDAFAGSGSVGIEAISRGAGMVYFLETNRKTLPVLEANLLQLGEGYQWRILPVTVTKGLKIIAEQNPPPGILFFDPPYDYDAYPELLSLCLQLFPDSLYVIECSARSIWEPPEGIQLRKSREIGETALRFYGRSSP